MTSSSSASRESAAPPTSAAGSLGSRRPGSPGGRAARSSWWQPLVVLVLLIALAYGISASFAARELGFLVPYPHQVLHAAVAEPAATSVIYRDLLNSVAVALTGLAIAVVLGIAWATIMAQARWAERALFPYAVVLQCIPILAITPLIGIIFGYSFGGRVIVTVLISLFPMVANTLFGLQAAEPAQRELFALQGASRWTQLTKLQFPAALPAIFVGLRNAAGLSVIGSIVGDQLLGQGSPGLGVAIQVFAVRAQGPESWAAITVAALFGVVVFLVFGLLGRLAVGRWFDSS